MPARAAEASGGGAGGATRGSEWAPGGARRKGHQAAPQRMRMLSRALSRAWQPSMTGEKQPRSRRSRSASLARSVEVENLTDGQGSADR